MTNPTTPGGNESSTPLPEEQLKKLLDRYEKGLGLPEFTAEAEPEAVRLLGLSAADVKGLTARECAEAVAILRKFAFHLARAAARERTVVNWAKSTVRRRVRGRLAAQRNYANFEERLLTATAEDTEAARLEKVQVMAQARLDRVEDMASHIGFYANSLSELHKRKERENG